MLALLASLLSCARPLQARAAQWAIDPTEPGPTVPPNGRSVFDELTRDGVPFPFEALLARLDRRLGCVSHSCIDAVLVPLGRSLQRMAAAPDFFGSPRVVVAVTGEGTGPLFARRQLYLGYQPRAALLEVISYNDAAGRFEFQVVHDYREGGHPRTTAAERAVCVACHQNHGPMFSRPLWSETQANPAVGAELRGAAGAAVARRGRWLGVDLQRGVDAPNAIDDATDAANLYAVTQRLWRDACNEQCRQQAVHAALRYRLSGGREFESLPAFAASFASAFPEGLAIPNPDLPNRDPLATAASGAMRAHVTGEFEALRPRAPLEVWNAGDPYLDRRFVLGLAAMFSGSDVAELRANPASAFRHLQSQRLMTATVSRAALRQALGLSIAAEACCGKAEVQNRAPAEDTAAQRRSTPVAERAPSALPRRPAPTLVPLRQAEAEFVAPCGGCHATDEHSPPNFLAGDPARVSASLRQCAPRMFVRLSMWQRDPAAWAKVPMPPPRAAEAGRPALQRNADPVVAKLLDTVAGWIAAEGRGAPSLDQLLDLGYENLRPCLPAGS